MDLFMFIRDRDREREKRGEGGEKREFVRQFPEWCMSFELCTRLILLAVLLLTLTCPSTSADTAPTSS
jgi:hypothetical protein